jgi:adenosylmethionine-8-amino-7-oxononanoate aminotransferase
VALKNIEIIERERLVERTARAIRDTLVMSPPLVISHGEIDQLIAIMRRSLDEAEPVLRAG